MTNVIAFLHTTATYQAAALQLMIAEANFVAEQLGIPERLPLQTNRLHIAEVGPPPRGVNGAVGTSNYMFSFDRGYLSSVKKLEWMKRMPITNLHELAALPSRIDTNGAYQFATQWLAGISVDVLVLNERFPSHVVQAIAPRRQPAEKSASPAKVPLPMFLLSWGERPPPVDLSNPVRMRLLGTTPELLELHIRDRSVFRRPRLTVSNAAQLLAPLPLPRDFVERLFGGPDGYRAIREAKAVELFVLSSRHREEEATLPEVRAGPVVLNRRQQKELSQILLDFETYQWGVTKACSPDYGVKVRFILGRSVVEVLFCFECDILQITVNGTSRHENFDFNHNALVRIMRDVFPTDDKIRRLEDNPDESEDRANFIQYLNRQTSED